MDIFVAKTLTIPFAVQINSYKWWKPTGQWYSKLSRAIGFTPLVFWGRYGYGYWLVFIIVFLSPSVPSSFIIIKSHHSALRITTAL